ncbi:hypothetical protein L6164_003321 [Bauhinia variegata]|uniref:Uncharacterized protein n=1 Tax=Bauhinia variegata TaxID=167791 RepID=A0ACB9Q0Z6_BAUVA|nr:hypothetical protein L6164_003321 [Bauhinia variegata]
MGSAPLGRLLFLILCITLLLISEPALGWGTVPYEPDIECQGPCNNRDDCFQQCNNMGFTKGGCCLGFNGSPFLLQEEQLVLMFLRGNLPLAMQRWVQLELSYASERVIIIQDTVMGTNAAAKKILQLN